MRKNQIKIQKSSDQEIQSGIIKTIKRTNPPEASVRLESDYETIAWSANTRKSVGDRVIPIVENNHEYRCSYGEGDWKTGNAQPIWPIGGYVVDGDVMWTDMGTYDSKNFLSHVEFYYHCEPNNTNDGHMAFEVEDEVLIAKEGSKNFIIGFKDLKPRSCASLRFFVKIKEGDSFEIYWLILLNNEGNYELSIKEPTDKTLMEKMLKTPFNNPHTHTKAFMLDIGNGNERWVAAPQILTKNRVQQFLPLHFPAEEDPPEKSPVYPTPALCGTPPEYGLAHYCPPNRFYCNTEENIMTWFTVKEDTCICGIVLNLEKNTVQNFLVESTDMNGEGFTSYWCVDRTNQEVPVSTIIDVIKLTQTELEILMPWEMRPTKVKISLVNGYTEYEEIDSCDHYYWSDGGFEKRSCASLEQSSEDHSGTEEIIITASAPDCSLHTNYDDCTADDNHLIETLGKRTVVDTSNISKRHSEYIINIFGASYSTDSDADSYSVSEALKEILTGCIWTTGGNCVSWGGVGSLLDVYQNRNICGHLYQKNMNTGLVNWICPNVLKIRTEYIKHYCDGEAEQRRNRVENMTPAAFEDMCYWGLLWPQSWLDLFTVAKCFQAGDMPGDIWNQMDSEYFFNDASWKVWHKETNQDEVTSNEIKKYSIDGAIAVDSSKYNRVYYLDDRSTEDSHGIIAAAKNFTKATEGAPEYVHDWKIYWAKSETSYSDITADVLAILGCTKEQLYEIGLI